MLYIAGRTRNLLCIFFVIILKSVPKNCIPGIPEILHNVTEVYGVMNDHPRPLGPALAEFNKVQVVASILNDLCTARTDLIKKLMVGRNITTPEGTFRMMLLVCKL